MGNIAQRAAVVFLLLALLLQTFSRLVIVADFYVTRDYIIKNLCVNRFNTAISCGRYSTAPSHDQYRGDISCAGKCQLNKRLREDNKDNSGTESRPDSRYEVLSSRSFYLTSFLVYHPTAIRDYPPVMVAYPVDRPAAIFHPPGWSLGSHPCA